MLPVCVAKAFKMCYNNCIERSIQILSVPTVYRFYLNTVFKDGISIILWRLKMSGNNVDMLISMIRKKFANKDLSGFTEKFAAEFRLTDGGVFYIEALNRNINIEPYEYNDKDVTISISSEDLKKILNKKLSIEKALITRKVKINGNLQKAMMIKDFLKE